MCVPGAEKIGAIKVVNGVLCISLAFEVQETEAAFEQNIRTILKRALNVTFSRFVR